MSLRIDFGKSYIKAYHFAVFLIKQKLQTNPWMINCLISLVVLSLYPQHKPRLIKKSEQTELEYFLNSKLTSNPFSTYLNKPNTDHNTPLNSKP